jgi:hypothetical protein
MAGSVISKFNLCELRKIYAAISERSSIPVTLKIKLCAVFGNQKPKIANGKRFVCARLIPTGLNHPARR